MPTEPCPSCRHPIRSDADGRFPPWCCKCGADIKWPVVAKASEPADLTVVTVHTVTQPHYFHGRHGFPGRRPGDAPAAITATIWGRCWKQHTCVECGCVYRYKIEREAGGESQHEQFARQAAETKLFRRLAREVDPNPCPSCGLIQPDMVGQGKRRGHGLATGAAAVLLVGLVGLSYIGDRLLIDDAAMYAAAVAGGVAVAHLVIALRNPNRNRDANLRRAEAAVAAGHVEIIARGTVIDSLPPSGNVTARHLLALACVVLAAPAFLSPVLLRAANGWPMQREFAPYVLGPGDDVTITLPTPTNTSSVFRHWRGQATTDVLNAAEIDAPPTLPTLSRIDSWHDVVPTSRSDLLLRELWATVHIPDDPALSRQTLHVRVNMLACFPVDKGLKKQGRDRHAKPEYEDRTLTMIREVTLLLGEVGCSRRYRESWAIGAVLGLLGSLAGGGILIGLATSLRRRALPAEITPLRSS